MATRTSERRFIAGAIKRPGALDAAVGGPASEHIRKVEWLAKHGTPQQRREAQLYLRVLRPASERKAHRR